MELCSVLCGSLDGCPPHSPETIITLLVIGYTPIQNIKSFKKINTLDLILENISRSTDNIGIWIVDLYN